MVLGLTIDLTVLARMDVWLPGLILGLALAPCDSAARCWSVPPSCTARSRRADFCLVRRAEGAVPILLGELLPHGGRTGCERLHGIVVVVVIFSVAVQGSLVPTVARRLGVPATRQAGAVGGRPAASSGPGYDSPGQRCCRVSSLTAGPDVAELASTSGSASSYAMAAVAGTRRHPTASR